jgi:hypothetical protein
MKKVLIKNVYQLVAIFVFLIGLCFTYIIAEVEDAPGFIFIGTAANILACSLLFGLGELINTIKINNEMLTDIYKEIKSKKD